MDSALVQRIVDDPDDDAARLVVADQLMEAGDTRGELIRLQCEGLEDRAALLLARHGAAWSAEVMALIGEGEAHFERGFVAEVTTTLAGFLAAGARLFAVAPITGVRLRLERDQVAELAASPLVGRLRSLGLAGNQLDARAVALLCESRHLGGLRRLDLSQNDIPDIGVRVLARGGLRLSALDLSANVIEDEGAVALAESPTLRLDELLLDEPGASPGNAVGADGALALAGLGLRRLSLAGNPVGDRGAEALARTPAAASLRRIGLANARIGEVGALALATSAHLDPDVLDLAGNPLGEEGRKALRMRFGGAFLS